MNMKRWFHCVVLLLALGSSAYAQQDLQRVAQLESRVSALEDRVKDLSSAGAALLLYGAFCALWAQNTGRNSWLWFFLGLLFSVITVLVLLAKNSGDLQRKRQKSTIT